MRRFDAMNSLIGIKVDVDTFVGMREGVPKLLALFNKYGIQASFFVPMGKDHTGWTVKRAFTRKGFLKKAGRVGVISTYGVRTLMHGLLLPGPEIAKTNVSLLKRILAEGHELGIHGLDHVFWHDHIKDMDKERTGKELEKACEVYKASTGRQPLSFAAPGWMINAHALRFFEETGFVYTSNTRGRTPFLPELGMDRFSILEIPTTLPTLDEVVGVAGTEIGALNNFYLNALTDGLNILTIHTELEGNRWTGLLEAFLIRTLEMGFTYKKLIDVAVELRDGGSVPVCRIAYGYVEGRAGEVTIQVS